jgi:hypothetical protein
MFNCRMCVCVLGGGGLNAGGRAKDKENKETAIIEETKISVQSYFILLSLKFQNIFLLHATTAQVKRFMSVSTDTLYVSNTICTQPLFCTYNITYIHRSLNHDLKLLKIDFQHNNMHAENLCILSDIVLHCLVWFSY